DGATQPTSEALPPISALNLAQIKPLMRFGRGLFESVTYSPDQKTLAVASSVGVWLYPMNDLNNPRLFESSNPIIRVAFSPDGALLAGTSWDGQIRLWNAQTGALKTTYTTDKELADSPAFSPDGKLFAAGLNGGLFSRAGKVYLW